MKIEKIDDYIVLDTETTGLSPKCCKITEICAARIRKGKIVRIFSTLLNPGIPIPAFITYITGITDEMVCDKPMFCEIADELKEFIGRDVIVGHNIRFDIGFLNAGFGEEISNDTLDTCCMARKLCPGYKSYKLESLCKEFGIADKQHHRAESDVILTHKLYEYLCSEKIC